MYMEFCDGKKLWSYFCRLWRGEGKEKMISESDEIFKGLLDNAEAMDNLIQLRKEMTDEDFVRTLEKIAVFEIYTKDLIRIFSKLNNIQYQGWYEISTTTKYDLLVIVTSDFEYKSDHYYSIDEINKLAESKKIVIVSEEEVFDISELSEYDLESGQWNEDDIENRVEKIETFSPIVYDPCGTIYWLDEYFVKSEGKYYDAIIKEIRKNPASNNRIREELQQYIQSIDMGMITIYEQIKMQSDTDKNALNYSEKNDDLQILTACLNNFKEKGYIKRLEKLKEKYPHYLNSSYNRNHRK